MFSGWFGSKKKAAEPAAAHHKYNGPAVPGQFAKYGVTPPSNKKGNYNDDDTDDDSDDEPRHPTLTRSTNHYNKREKSAPQHNTEESRENYEIVYDPQPRYNDDDSWEQAYDLIVRKSGGQHGPYTLINGAQWTEDELNTFLTPQTITKLLRTKTDAQVLDMLKSHNAARTFYGGRRRSRHHKQKRASRKTRRARS